MWFFGGSPSPKKEHRKKKKSHQFHVPTSTEYIPFEPGEHVLFGNDYAPLPGTVTQPILLLEDSKPQSWNILSQKGWQKAPWQFDEGIVIPQELDDVVVSGVCSIRFVHSKKEKELPALPITMKICVTQHYDKKDSILIPYQLFSWSTQSPLQTFPFEVHLNNVSEASRFRLVFHYSYDEEESLTAESQGEKVNLPKRPIPNCELSQWTIVVKGKAVS